MKKRISLQQWLISAAMVVYGVFASPAFAWEEKYEFYGDREAARPNSGGGDYAPEGYSPYQQSAPRMGGGVVEVLPRFPQSPYGQTPYGAPYGTQPLPPAAGSYGTYGAPAILPGAGGGLIPFSGYGYPALFPFSW